MTKTQLVGGGPVTPDHREINPATGQQKDYVVLTAEERAKGFVRPVRTKYVHSGAHPEFPLRDLTPEERERYAAFNYTKYEEYPASKTPLCGRYWTARELKGGCGVETRMSQEIAETYARDPKFYSGTFCCGCRAHFPLEEFKWSDTDITVGT